MTKKQLVEGIQRAEAKLWKELQEAKALFGMDDIITQKRRAEWSGVYELRNALGIEAMRVSQLKAEGLLPNFIDTNKQPAMK